MRLAHHRNGLLGATLGLALVIAGVAVASPAYAEQKEFANPLVTADGSDLDISSTEVSFAAWGLTARLSLENATVVDDAPGLDVRVRLSPTAAGAFEPGGDFVEVSAVGRGDAREVKAYRFLDGVPTRITQVFGESYSSYPATGQLVNVQLGLPTGAIPTGWNEVYVSAVVTDFTGTTRLARAAVPGQDVGFGPVTAPRVTRTTVALSASTYVVGGAVVRAFARVQPATASGSVAFYDADTKLGTAPLVDGEAELAVPPSLGFGGHDIRAEFVPSKVIDYLASASGPVTLTVEPRRSPQQPTVPTTSVRRTTTTLKLSSARQPYRKAKKAVKATVSVTGAPAGRVVLLDGRKQIGRAVLRNGKATCRISPRLKPGKHRIAASFTPADATRFGPSTSKAVTLTVMR